MAIYTYDEFEKAAANAGVLSQFSDADLKLAQSNPDVGMSLLKYKKDYMNAKTDSQRALANAGAEKVRSSYGGYTGGGDGGSFHLDPLSPNDFPYSSAPSYKNQYTEKINALLDSITNRPQFSYDPENDPLYGAAKKAYTREARRATADTLATVGAASGGVPSSYAVTAASQAGDYYASQLPDKMQDLYQLAYNQYMQEHNMKLSELSAVQSAEQSEYQKYLAELDKHNSDRSFAYGQHIDEINNQSAKRAEEIGLKQSEEEKKNTAYERQLELARLAASAGDYSYLEKLLGGKINIPNTSVSYQVDGSNDSGYDPGYDKKSFDADLEFALKRDKAENTQKYSQKVYADYDAGLYGGSPKSSDIDGEPGDISGDTPGGTFSPTSVDDFEGANSAAKNNAAYEYLRGKYPGTSVLSERSWVRAKESGNNEMLSAFDSYARYLNFMFEYLTGKGD